VELLNILIKASKAVAKAEECQFYIVGRDNEDENSIIVSEVWDSAEDHKNSLQLPEVRSLIGQAIPLLAGQPEQIAKLKVFGGKGLD
jgi:quinol monooxygenase YgiN